MKKQRRSKRQPKSKLPALLAETEVAIILNRYKDTLTFYADAANWAVFKRNGGIRNIDTDYGARARLLLWQLEDLNKKHSN